MRRGSATQLPGGLLVSPLHTCWVTRPVCFVAPADLLVLKHVNMSFPCGAAVCTQLQMFSPMRLACGHGLFLEGGLIFVRQLWANESLFVPVYHVQG